MEFNQWKLLDSAPFDVRVLLRDPSGITIGQRTLEFGFPVRWFDDYAGSLNPDAWMPLPDRDQN